MLNSRGSQTVSARDGDFVQTASRDLVRDVYDDPATSPVAAGDAGEFACVMESR